MKDLLTADQVAALLDITRVAVYKMAAEGRLESVKVGSRVLFRQEDVAHMQGTVPAPKGEKKMLDYWMIPRSTRKLVGLQQMVREDLANGIIGAEWSGARANHRRRDLLLQASGLRGKSEGGFVDKNPGGARTDVALLRALGLYALDDEGCLELTDQGKTLAKTTAPAAVITEQLFQFRYPSPYSVSIRMNPEIELFPYRFLLELLTREELADDGSVLADDGVIRVSQKEIATYVIPGAKSHKDMDRIVKQIVQARRTGKKLQPDDTLDNIANTFINNLEITNYLDRQKGTVALKDEVTMVTVLERLATPPRSFGYEADKENEFQHRLGQDPAKKRFTKSQTSARERAEMALRHLLEGLLANFPMTRADITPELIAQVAGQIGTTEDKVTAVLNEVLKREPADYFSKQFLEYSMGGRTFAREFELATKDIFSLLAENVRWVGKEGSAPDLEFTLVRSKGIVDCKAEERYNISNDHFNRMSAERGYINTYHADFFLYVAHSFGTNFPAKLKELQEFAKVKGSGITAEDLLYVLDLHRQEPFAPKRLLELFTCGRVITKGDINTAHART
jgi:excisionase family DNA binding protein